ncbi:acyltransferase [Massilia sp. 9096]|uniref:acyltransferase family protein n=1 Tax=Massilia sp. 9096 TaxID=1500894 RepID=UPI0005669BA3|nr:acyltransferase [Massilia sp. 9096]
MTQASRIQHIDAWRCIAVLMVLVHHVTSYSHPWYGGHVWAGILSRSWKFGHLGVLIFFCISGYVICRGLVREQTTARKVDIREFYLRRFFRIVPPLGLYMLALLFFSLSGAIDVQGRQFARAALFTCNLEAACGWYLAHTWSLAYEEQFYLVFPFVFVLSTIMGGRRTLLISTLATMGGALIAGRSGFDHVAEFATVFSYMLTGCVAGAYWDDIAPHLRKIALPSWAALCCAIFVLGLVVTLPYTLQRLVDVMVVPVLICAAVLATPVSNRLVGGLFLNRTVCHLGKISFTVYLWQQLATASHPEMPPFYVLIALGGVFLLAFASYQYVELPLMRFASARSAVKPAQSQTDPETIIGESVSLST